MLLKALFLSLILTLTLFAHQTALSYIDLHENEDKSIDLLYKKPLENSKAKDLTIHYPTHCAPITPKRKKIENGYIQESYRMWCGESALAKSRIWVEGMQSNDIGVIIKYESAKGSQDALLRASTPFIYIDRISSPFEVFTEYLILGIEHILLGYDHLLFVLALLLLARNTKALLWAITGFTLSHSITLACGILGIVTISVKFVEASIALSIIFLARELLSPAKTLTKAHLEIIAFTFGLLHGFGFSSVLSEIGLPHNDIALSLFAFNVGIELGQIIFILSLVILYRFVQRVIRPSYERLKWLSAYAIGSMATFWFLERVVP